MASSSSHAFIRNNTQRTVYGVVDLTFRNRRRVTETNHSTASCELKSLSHKNKNAQLKPAFTHQFCSKILQNQSQ